MKDEIRVLGIDDGYFLKEGESKVLVVGTVMRGNRDLDGVLSCFLKKDGLDSTKKLADLVNKSKHKNQLRVLMVNGVTLGGFNVLDIHELSRKTGLPVISVSRKKPNFKNIKRALDHFKDKKKRLDLISKAGKIYTHKRLYFQIAGIGEAVARQVLDKTLAKSNIPEPIRIAHLIASGVTYGESTKRA